MLRASKRQKALSMADGVEGDRRIDAAILVADVHGYTAHMARDEARTFARVLMARQLCGRLIADYGGRYVQTVGDSILAFFEQPEQGVRFACAFQRDAARALAWDDAEPLRFRIGLHWGQVVLAGGEVYGYAISIAERLQRLSAPGGV